MNPDQDVEASRQKAKRATRLAIVSLFLLALVRPIDGSLAWIFFGATAYFGFLVWYYSNQAKPGEPEWRKQTTYGNPASATTPRKFSPIVIVAIISGFMFLTVIVRVLFSGGNSAGPVDEDASEEKTEVTTTTESVSSPVVNSLVDRGNELYNQGNYDSAMIQYEKALVIEPDNQYALYDKALVFYARKQYDRSIPMLHRCLNAHPDYGEAYWLLGDIFQDRQRLDSATFCFDRAYENGLRNGSFLQNMASVYETQDRTRAIELYKESLQQDSTLIDGYKKLMEFESSNAEEYRQMLKKWTPK